AEIDSINTLNLKLEELALKRGTAREALLGQAQLDAYSALTDQAQRNVDSALRGFREVISSYESFRHGAVDSILGPIGETFVDRTAEQFIRKLSDVDEGVFANVAAVFGESTEQILQRRLHESFLEGGDIIRIGFINAGEHVAQRIARAM